MILRLNEANKLAKELSDRKKELKAAMFDNKLASFKAFPSLGDASLGELAFGRICQTLLGELTFAHEESSLRLTSESTTEL